MAVSLVKAIFLFITICCSLFFVNYKFSKAIRILAFQEEESPWEAIISFSGMIVISVFWTIYLLVI